MRTLLLGVFLLCIMGCLKAEDADEQMERFSRLVHFGTYMSINDKGAKSHYNWNFHLIYFYKDRFRFAGEINYTTRHKDVKLTGVKYTPIDISYNFSDKPYNGMAFGGCSFSYLDNNNKLNNGYLISPYIGYDLFGLITTKATFDYDVKNKVPQFGITATIGISAIAQLFYYINKGN